METNSNNINKKFKTRLFRQFVPCNEIFHRFRNYATLEIRGKFNKGGEDGCLNIEAAGVELYNKDMTSESNSRIPKDKYPRAAEIQAVVDYGIDVSMLIDNIHRSYSERIKRHQIALNTAEKLKGARRL